MIFKTLNPICSRAYDQIKKAVSVLLLLTSCGIYGQSFADNPTQIREIPTTPTMWEFEKYGNYPVSLHTGVPDISIPLTTARSGQIEIPVSLSYHASGIKVDEKASWVGLGWSLQAGGAITRTVRGSVDEWNKGYIDYTYYNPGEFDPAYGNNYNEMEEMLQGFIDTEPDIFQYSFMGYSGKFIFDHSTSRNSATISMIPHNDLIVVPTFSASGQDIISFTVTTPEGFVVEFAYPERSSEYRAAGLIGSLTVAANTTWHIKKITAPNGIDEMSFEYKLVPGINSSSPGIVIDERISQSESVNYADPCFPNQPSVIQATTSNNGVVFYSVKRLEKIIFNNGYIYFGSSSGNRLDDPDDEDLRLDQVQLYSSIGGVNTLIKSFQMQYGYFGSINSLNSVPDEYEVRLQLEQVTEKGSDNSSKNPYVFDYVESIGNYGVPARFSTSQDYWGYFNGYNNTSLVPSYYYQGYSDVYFGDANRNVNPIVSKMGMLKRVTYPTKGYTDFEFEGNKATITTGVTDVQHDTGGLRVKNIKSYNTDASLKWEKSYEYVRPDNNSISSGVYNASGNAFIDAADFLNGRPYYFTGYLCGGSELYSRISNSVSLYSYPTLSNNFATVFYAYVKEYNGSVTSYEGYTWYQYDTTKDTFVNGTGPIAFSVDRSWDRGQLLKEEFYANGNTSPVKSITYNYEERTVRTPISAYKPGTRFDVESIGYVPPNAPAYSFRNNQYFLTYYSEPVIWKRLASKITEENGIKIKENYFYDNELDHTNMVKTNMTNSNGTIAETKLYYPDDVVGTTTLEGGSLSTLEYNAISALKKNGSSPRVGQVIQKTTLQNNKKSIERTNFKIWNGSMVLPTSLETAKGTASVESRVDYHNYDSQGRLLEVSRTKGSHVYYVWGYNNQFPIAKVDNLSSGEIDTTVQNLIDVSVSASNADDSVVNENNLRTALTNLRVGLPSAMVTTYTYDPLIGVTSITDPKGYTTYYEYDEFGRLEFIKDANDNLIQEYKYNYKN